MPGLRNGTTAVLALPRAERQVGTRMQWVCGRRKAHHCMRRRVPYRTFAVQNPYSGASL